jgi:PAS domain-containing protein
LLTSSGIVNLWDSWDGRKMTTIEVVLSLLSGLLASGLVMYWATRNLVQVKSFSSDDPSVSFLFEGAELVDSTENAKQYVHSSHPSWRDVVLYLQSRFDLPEDILTPNQRAIKQTFFSQKDNDNSLCEIHLIGRYRRIDIRSKETSASADLPKLNVDLETYTSFKGALSTTPVPIWQQDDEGRVLWYNAAYKALSQMLNSKDAQNLSEPVFKLGGSELPNGKTRRLRVYSQSERRDIWFDIHKNTSDEGSFFTALDADAAVRAEIAQRNFVQTLAKTFAQLPIGLAIFDGNRQLALFNPALIDLTGLSAEFLSARPNLLSFFDELRDRRLMPEPKDYRTWRQQISDLVVAASDGRYSETWTLPNARTYRVNGRPHPDGAIAFLIEDISSEVSLTRSFRAELELGQAVFDSLDNGIAVFSSTGLLTLTNAKYRELWDEDPESSFAETTILDCQRDWQNKAQQDPTFQRLSDFVLNYGDREPWSANIQQLNGKTITIEAVPMASSNTMLRFFEGSKIRPKAEIVSLPLNA